MEGTCQWDYVRSTEQIGSIQSVLSSSLSADGPRRLLTARYASVRGIGPKQSAKLPVGYMEATPMWITCQYHYMWITPIADYLPVVIHGCQGRMLLWDSCTVIGNAGIIPGYHWEETLSTE